MPRSAESSPSSGSPTFVQSPDGLGTALLGLLAFPWFVHAAAVLLSALGARPLAGPVPAVAVLGAGIAFALTLSSWARRGAWLPFAQPTENLAPWPRRFALALAACGAGALLLSLLLAVVLPVVAYDALAYRLPVIAQWLDAGRIAWVQSDDPVRNGYPMGQETVSAVVAAATGTLRFACATSFFYLASGALAIWLLAEASGVRRALARSAAAIFVLVPMMILNAPSGYVDAAFAGATVALLCTASLFASAQRPAPWMAAACGMAAADVLALKGTGVAFVVLVMAGVALRVWLGRASRSQRIWPSAAIALGFALPGAFWSLRNIAYTGNPLWPVRIQIAGHTLRGIGGTDYVIDAVHNTPAAFASVGAVGRVLRTWIQWKGPAADFDDRMAGLGWAWPMLALPAIVALAWAWLRTPKSQRGGDVHHLAFVLLLTASCFALQPMSWWPRYTLWVWGAGALALAVLAERLAAAGRQRLLSSCLMLALLLCVGEGALAMTHAKDAKIAIARWLQPGATLAELSDPRRSLHKPKWIAPEFWELGIERDPDVCRGAWKPSGDNANLDGVLAQLSPRPRVHVVLDDHSTWPRVRKAWQAAGCARLLLLEGSPVLASAERDPAVSVERVVAFDPLFIVRPRTTVALGRFEDLQP